jgi:hypothetical protein
MVLTELDPAHSKLLCALTLAVCKHLAEPTLEVDENDNVCRDWRMACLDDVVFLEKPADDRARRRIDCDAVPSRARTAARARSGKVDLCAGNTTPRHRISN